MLDYPPFSHQTVPPGSWVESPGLKLHFVETGLEIDQHLADQTEVLFVLCSLDLGSVVEFYIKRARCVTVK